MFDSFVLQRCALVWVQLVQFQLCSVQPGLGSAMVPEVLKNVEEKPKYDTELFQRIGTGTVVKSGQNDRCSQVLL